LADFTWLEKERQKLLATEDGTIRKSGYFPLEVGLVALSPYALAMNSLGFQTVYRLFNSHPEVRCERIFNLSPETASEKKGWVSLESGRRAVDYSVFALSVSYEQECLLLPAFLKSSGIPLYASERSQEDPIIFCGGAVITANPEPVALFVDVCGIGDGEKLVPAFVETWLEALQKGWERKHLLFELAGRKGFYVPSFYASEAASGENRSVVLPRVQGVPRKVERAIEPLQAHPAHSVVVSSAAHFRGMFLVEIARGCRWACRFCLVCSINRPYRDIKADRILEVLQKLPPRTRAVGLVGANLCDHPQLESIIESVAGLGLHPGVSSLRVDTVKESLIGLLRNCGVHSITLAPETASEKLLASLGKRYVREQLFEVVGMIARAGFENLKLYYMIGLPGEDPADRQALVEQIRELSRLLPSRMKLKVSLNPFIPKPHTAWQDEPMMKPAQIKSALRSIRKALADCSPAVQIQTRSIAGSVAQAVISMGDRTIARAIARAGIQGLRFLDCLKQENLDLEPILYTKKKYTQLYPWKHLGE